MNNLYSFQDVEKFQKKKEKKKKKNALNQSTFDKMTELNDPRHLKTEENSPSMAASKNLNKVLPESPSIFSKPTSDVAKNNENNPSLKNLNELLAESPTISTKPLVDAAKNDENDYEEIHL